MQDEDIFFDFLLGEWRLKDTQQVIEKVVEVRGGGGTTTVVSGGTATVTVQADEPASGNQGDMWLDTDDNQLYIYVDGVWTAIAGGGGAPTGGTFDFIDGTSFDFVDGTYFDFIT